jgi:hypothetical protein
MALDTNKQNVWGSSYVLPWDLLDFMAFSLGLLLGKWQDSQGNNVQAGSWQEKPC